jgi:hypothetical protein
VLTFVIDASAFYNYFYFILFFNFFFSFVWCNFDILMVLDELICLSYDITSTSREKDLERGNLLMSFWFFLNLFFLSCAWRSAATSSHSFVTRNHHKWTIPVFRAVPGVNSKHHLVARACCINFEKKKIKSNDVFMERVNNNPLRVSVSAA